MNQPETKTLNFVGNCPTCNAEHVLAGNNHEYFKTMMLPQAKYCCGKYVQLREENRK